MSAIERCRTAALGGHVARCENSACGHTLISYNSCLMGKFGNGESDRINSDAIELSSNFHSPLRVPPQQSDKQQRRARQMSWTATTPQMPYITFTGSTSASSMARSHDRAGGG